MTTKIYDAFSLSIDLVNSIIIRIVSLILEIFAKLEECEFFTL